MASRQLQSRTQPQWGNEHTVKHTRFELTSLRNTETGDVHQMFCNLPMNTPLMLVRRRGDTLEFKRLKHLSGVRIKEQVADNQVSLL